jgi:hypothetical protein
MPNAGGMEMERTFSCDQVASFRVLAMLADVML